MHNPPRWQQCLGMALAMSAALGVAGVTVPTAATASPAASSGRAADQNPAADQDPAVAPRTPALSDGSTTVTLVTGDVVHVSRTAAGTLAISTDPATGQGGGVTTETVGGDVYVIPDAAQKYLAADLVDRRLFDVTLLLQDRYDDESTPAVPLIAQYDSPRATRSVLPDASVVRALTSIDGSALEASKARAHDFWQAVAPRASSQARSVTGAVRLGDGLAKIWLDGKAQEIGDPVGSTIGAAEAVAAGAKAAAGPRPAEAASDLDWDRTIIGADKAWAEGYDGTGSKIAVLDTGVDATHPDLAGAIAETRSFVPDEAADTDVHGHGTHVSSTALGRGIESDGEYAGVAPGASLLMGKVLGDDGYGQDSWILSGMEWAAQNADVVSMSLGDPSFTDGQDPISQALDTLSRQTGTLFVVAAGNAYDSGTVSAPGAADEALTVGATDEGDQRAVFSSWGPRTGDSAIKPDLSAPGQGIVAARSQESAEGTGWYISMDGTSMATPHVAGAAAIVHEAHPDWTGAQIKAALVSSTDPIDGTVYEVGSGRLDVPAAIDGVDETGSGFLGGYDWPQDGDDPVTRTLTYTNDTDTAVTLDLALTFDDPNGNPVDGVHLSADTVTVPAHGSSQVTMTADNDDFSGTGTFTGEVVGTTRGGGPVVRTSVALYREPERYGLSISARDRAGQPTGGDVEFYRYGDQFASSLPIDPVTGTVQTQRLAPGVYTATAYLDVQGAEPGTNGVALVGNPHIEITDHDVNVVLDASKAVPVTLKTPKPAVTSYQRMQWFHDSGIGGSFATYSSAYTAPAEVTSLYAQPTGHVGGARYDFAVRWRDVETPLDLATQGHGAPVKLAPTYLTGSERLDGPVRMTAVSVGAGAPTDYPSRGVSGKAVVVTRNDTDLGTQIQTAQSAGAALVVLAGPDPMPVGLYLAGATVPVVWVTPTVSRLLLARLAATPAVTLTGMANEDPAYLFDITHSYPGGIPSDLALAPSLAGLATVTTTATDTRDRHATEGRYDCRDYQWPPCIGPFNDLPTRTTRTDYVSTQSANTWYSEVNHEDGWDQRGAQETFRPGQRLTQAWFSPLVSAHTGPGYWGPVHNGTWFTINVPQQGGAGLTTGARDASSVTSALYAGETLLDQEQSQAVYVDVPATDGPATYRFEQTATSDPSVFAYSTTIQTSWTFVADPDETATSGDGVVLPMLQLGYAVDTDLSGTVKSGTRVPLRVTPGFDAGASHAGSITKVSVAVSFDDGKTWQQVPTARLGSSWATSIATPRRGASAVSLKVSASDDAGNAVTQQIGRAFGLR